MRTNLHMNVKKMSVFTKFFTGVLSVFTGLRSRQKIFVRNITLPSCILALIISFNPVMAAPGPAEQLAAGHWQNQSRGDVMGFITHNRTQYANGNRDCTFYAEPAFKPRIEHPCQYKLRDRQLEIYLLNAQGECGAVADFNAELRRDTQALNLTLPGQSPVVLYLVADPADGNAPFTP